MTRINTNVSSLTAQNRLQRTNIDLQSALTRLSTGLRINSGKDDPAGLIASESLRSDITSIGKALSNTQRANQIIGTADSALGQVSSLLNDVRGLVTEAANKGALSDDEIAANQLQIDSSLEAINRIAQTTTFQGKRLLDGSLDFQVQQGAGFTTVRDLQIDSANLGAAGTVAVSVNITAAATKGLVTAAVPAPLASAKAAATFTFDDSTVGAESTGTINFADSFVPGAESTGDVILANSTTAFVEANGTLTLASGAAFKITAKDGTVVDGAAGNGVTINVTTGATTTGAYDTATNTLSLTLATGATAATAVTALSAITAVTDLFSFSGGNATNVAAGDAGIKTSVLSGGTDTVATTRTQSSANAVVVNATNGYTFDIDAIAGGSFDGARGATTDFTYNIVGTGGSSATYDAANNTVAFTIDRTQTIGAITTAINSGLTGQFTFSTGAVVGTPVNVAATVINNPLTTAGTDTPVAGASRAGFKLSAKDGGAADGLKGDSTVLNLTAAASGSATSAIYNATNNTLNVTVGKGATVTDIANAINTQGDFVASNTKFGTYKFASTDTGANAATFTGGADTTATSAFKLTAIDGGLADGVLGNSTDVRFTAGSATSASYDLATNELRVIVAANATIQNVADAISSNVGGVFGVSNISNGSAKFAAAGADFTTRTDPLTGGTTNAAGLKDELVISATAAGATANGVTVTFQEDATVTTGTPTAAIVSGNIVVKVNNAGNTLLSSIATAINGLTGYSATLSPTSNGDGFYKAASEAPPSVGTLTGGITGGGLSADVTFQLTGGSGSEVFKFQKGATTDNVIQSVNLLKDSTGIEATFNSTSNRIEFSSVEYGSAGIVGIEILSEGSGGTLGSGLVGGPRSIGTDVQATVNGTVTTGKGNNIKLNTSTLNVSFTVADGSSTAVNFSITGGGAQFQIGPNVVSNQQARLGIGSLNTAKIGGVSGKLFELSSSGSKSLTKDVSGASKVVNEAISKVTTLRGRLGAFQRTALESNVNSLNDTLLNLNEAQSSIRDADFAKESANLTRAQILIQSGTSVLGIANQSAQNVLSLLR